jgi:hypothetical protein
MQRFVVAFGCFGALVVGFLILVTLANPPVAPSLTPAQQADAAALDAAGRNVALAQAAVDTERAQHEDRRDHCFAGGEGLKPSEASGILDACDVDAYRDTETDAADRLSVAQAKYRAIAKSQGGD